MDRSAIQRRIAERSTTITTSIWLFLNADEILGLTELGFYEFGFETRHY